MTHVGRKELNDAIAQINKSAREDKPGGGKSGKIKPTPDSALRKKPVRSRSSARG